MKQHYLPEFYLKGFLDPAALDTPDPYLWIFDLKEREKGWRRRAPKNVATESEYYTITDPQGGKDRTLEGALGTVEDSAARIIRDTIGKRRPLTVQQRIDFARFVAVMMQRVPVRHEQMARFFGELGKSMLGMSKAEYERDPDALERFKERYRRETGTTDLDDLKAGDLDPNLPLRVSREPIIAMALGNADRVAPVICAMGWSVLTSSPPDPFITSDHPFYMMDPTSTQRSFYGPGLMNRDIQVTFPISSEIALLARWGTAPLEYGEAPTKIVRSINLRTAMISSVLISSRPDFPGLEALKLTTAPLTPETTTQEGDS